MAGDDYRVKLDLFEGPLDLLLFLIRKNELDIYDIPIAVITEQYLGYLDIMKSLNVDLAADFLAMASTLVHIKSRMLLPSHSEDEDEEDPRMEIVRPLLEYMQIKEAAMLLGEREVLNRDVFVRDFLSDELLDSGEDKELISVSLFDLLAAFKRVMEQRAMAREVTLPPHQTSVQDAMDSLLTRLRTQRNLQFKELFDGDGTRMEFVTTFLAVLELVRLNLIRVVQVASSGPIRLFLNPEAGEGARDQ
jgi:segregation and condensation protein A